MVQRKKFLSHLEVPSYEVEDLPIDEIQRLTKQSKIAKLSFNESPYGASPKVKLGIEKAYQEISKYGDPYQRELVEALSIYTGQPEDHIVFGNGADELIDLVCRAFVGPGDEVLLPLPIFGTYLMDPVISGAQVKMIPVQEGLEIDLQKVSEGITEKTKVIGLCNPNNPTGRVLPTSEIAAWLKTVPTHILVVVDEAYAEYAEDPSYYPMWKELGNFPNLIILRTFSKVFGLPSLRLGYGVANPPIVHSIEVCRKIANVNSFAALAGVAALADLEFVGQVVEKNRQEREKLAQALAGFGFVVLPSQTNFLMVRVGESAEALWNYLKEKGIFTRMGWGLTDYIRISLGNEEENDWLIEEIRQWLDLKRG